MTQARMPVGHQGLDAESSLAQGRGLGWGEVQEEEAVVEEEEEGEQV